MRLVLASFLCLSLAGFLSAAEPKSIGTDPSGEASQQFFAGHFDQAIAVLAKAERTDAASLALRGCIALEQGKLDQATADFRAASEKDPNLPGPRLNLGVAFLRQKKWAEARAVFEDVLKQTNVLLLGEKLRYGIFLTHVGAKDDAGARNALAAIPFPSQSAAYYYAQAAWASAHGNQRAAGKWLETAAKIYDEKQVAWFARPLYDFGWLKVKPSPVCE